MKRRDVMAAAAGSLAGLPAGGASAESGLLVGSLGAQWKRAALNLGVEFRSIEQPDKSWIVKWSNQGVFGVRGGIEMPMAEMPSIEGLRLAVMHEPLPVGHYLIHRFLTRPFKFTDEDKDEFHKISVSFEIQPGRVTYLGELVTWMSSGVDLPFGLVAPTGMMLTLRDECARDLRVLRAHGVAGSDETPLRVAWLDGDTPERIKRVP